ncbi:hypothetical protein BX265_5291 [Streptomyces sp. TLI_235]|nr:hypothetical protein [Streptomyces sp. TLI_235]PBC70736.1 hypothetical protein BX265_5291 [Streptomyces sp. TLI_235]
MAETGCAMMKREAKALREEIRRLRRTVTEFEAKIRTLEAEPDPDRRQIEALRQAVARLGTKVDEDEAAAADLESVITENCPP